MPSYTPVPLTRRRVLAPLFRTRRQVVRLPMAAQTHGVASCPDWSADARCCTSRRCSRRCRSWPRHDCHRRAARHAPSAGSESSAQQNIRLVSPQCPLRLRLPTPPYLDSSARCAALGYQAYSARRCNPFQSQELQWEHQDMMAVANVICFIIIRISFGLSPYPYAPASCVADRSEGLIGVFFNAWSTMVRSFNRQQPRGR